VISRAVPLEKYEAAGEVIGTSLSPAMIFAVPAVVPSWKFTEPVSSTWMDAESALLWSKKFIMLSLTRLKVAVPASLIS
jgi:Na+-driven multidrug efflux pump